jgi:hypothetical protein
MTMATIDTSVATLAAEVARSLVRVTEVGQGARIVTPLLYPGGSMIAAELSRFKEGFLVTDGGGAHREALLLGGEKTFVRIARETAERFGVRFDSQMIFDINVPEEQVTVAVIAVANAAKTAVEATAFHLSSAPSADYRAMLWERLERLYRVPSVSRRRRIRGASDLWEFDAVVERQGHLSLFEVVVPHANAVTSAVTKFLDVQDLGEAAPSRIAVLVKKDETPHLAVLARTAQTIKANDPDEIFLRAA